MGFFGLVIEYFYMSFLKIPSKFRQEFISSLPSASFKASLLKSIVVLVIGTVLSIVLSVLLFSLDALKDLMSEFAISKLVQDLVISALIIIVFFRSTMPKTKGLLLPKVRYKSYAASLFTLFTLFLIVSVAFISLAISSQTNLSETQLEEIKNFYSQKMDFNYLIKSAQGLLFLLIGAFFEEFVFRFTIFRYLRRRGFLLSLVASSLLFSLVHTTTGIPFAFIAGLIFAIHYEYTNNLVTTSIVHAFHNYFNVYYASYVAYLFIR